MSDAGTLINQFVAAAASDGDVSVFAVDLATLLSSRALSLLHFIQALGPTLTSDSTVARSHAMNCLAMTLANCLEKPIFSRQDVAVLLQFLLAKLEDEKLSVHVLSALTTLVQFSTFTPNVNDSLSSLLGAILNTYEPRKHLAKVRYEAFRLLQTIFDTHADAIASIPSNGEIFVSAFIHVASGEKDPRNLLMSFSLNSSINQSLTFEPRQENEKHNHLLSELFDVCFCYFPISFTPPANDPYKITADQLKTHLRKTIASQSQFAQDAFPSLFEKLTSTNPSVRNNTLQCLEECIVQYSASTVESYWVSIWDALKFEILHNDVSVFKPEADYILPTDFETLDDVDETKTLFLTLRVLGITVGKLQTTETFPNLVSSVTTEMTTYFKTLTEKTCKQAVVLLCTLSCYSTHFYEQFIHTLFSFEVWGKFIRSDYQETEPEEAETDVSLTISRQRELVDYIGFLLSACKILGEPSVLAKYKDHLLMFLGQSLQMSSSIEKTLKCKIFQQLTKMVLLDGFLTKEDLQLVLSWFGENFSSILESTSETEWKSDILLQEITKGLVKIMTESSEESSNVNVSSVIDTVVPMLLDRASEPRVLEILQSLCVNYQLLEVLSIRFLNKMIYDEYDAEVFGNYILSLTKSFVQTQAAKPFTTTSWAKSFLPRFVGVVFKKGGDDAMLLELGATLFGYVVRYIDQSKHQAVLDQYVAVFMGETPIDGVSVENVSEVCTKKITFFKYLIAKIDKTVVFSAYKPKKLMDKFIAVVRSECGEIERIGYLQSIAVLANKFMAPGDKDIEELTESLLSAHQSQSLEIAIWIIKGLIVKLDPTGRKILDSVVNKLMESEDIDYCRQISRSFAVLMCDNGIFSNEEYSKTKIISGVVNLNVKLLYKQQIFQSLVKELIGHFNEGISEDRREVYLSTLAIIIANVSTNILKPHLKEILPLVLSGLALHNANVLKVSLQTFKVIIKEMPDLIQENLGSLLDKLGDLSSRKIVVNKRLVNDEQIRGLSLDCILGIFLSLDYAKVVRYQETSKRQVTGALDDNKRTVRKKAADVLQMLHELGR